jgi:hypothetical protein
MRIVVHGHQSHPQQGRYTVLFSRQRKAGDSEHPAHDSRAEESEAAAGATAGVYRAQEGVAVRRGDCGARGTGGRGLCVCAVGVRPRGFTSMMRLISI